MHIMRRWMDVDIGSDRMYTVSDRVIRTDGHGMHTVRRGYVHRIGGDDRVHSMHDGILSNRDRPVIVCHSVRHRLIYTSRDVMCRMLERYILADTRSHRMRAMLGRSVDVIGCQYMRRMPSRHIQ